MKPLKFKCTLLSDIILNQKAATEGPNTTLDFIPGSNFLGIVASALYKDGDKQSLEIFHSGKVRFGDAHPSKSDMRSLKVPACMYYPKLGSPEKELYVHYAIQNIESPEIKQLQLKQCRSGFYNFSSEKAMQVNVETQFAIKSEHDKVNRRSMDEKLYGYQSLEKGSVFYFSVEVDDEAYKEKIKDALVGAKRIGRSRTAQYGLVEIEEYEYNEVKCGAEVYKDYVAVYADSRLIFLDDNGLPTCQPTAEQLGFEKGTKICYEKSQIRTFQYAPWNFKRQCFDTDRYGIEKGSVILVETNKIPAESAYLGAYNNEGFGRVLYNPVFLKADGNGFSEYTLQKDKEKPMQEVTPLSGTSLLDFVAIKKKEEELERIAYSKVMTWMCPKNVDLFEGEKFPSQWGNIRRIALQNKTKEEIKAALFTGEHAFLTRGVAKDKWQEKGRLSKLQEFINDDDLTDENIQQALINLASEMAKKK
jgi:hypothetical protein